MKKDRALAMLSNQKARITRVGCRDFQDHSA